MPESCFECATPIENRRKSARFCCPACQKAHNNRAVREAVAMWPLVKAWALGRGGGHTPGHPEAREAMRELTRLARDLNDADKAAGRPDALAYYESLTSDGTQYTDRKRR